MILLDVPLLDEDEDFPVPEVMLLEVEEDLELVDDEPEDDLPNPEVILLDVVEDELDFEELVNERDPEPDEVEPEVNDLLDPPEELYEWEDPLENPLDDRNPPDEKPLAFATCKGANSVRKINTKNNTLFVFIQ